MEFLGIRPVSSAGLGASGDTPSATVKVWDLAKGGYRLVIDGQANGTRAFRRMSGVTPWQFREQWRP